MMLRTQAIEIKNKKKKQASSIKVNKIKGAKSEGGDKAKSRANVGENGKIGVKTLPQIKVQGQSYVENQLPPTVDYADRKLERSNSFFLTRQLTKIYDSLTNSKESLKDNETCTKNETKTPFKFIRSVSLAAISLKKDYRNSIRKPKLEQLSEEDHPFGMQTEKSKQKYEKKSKTASIDSLSSRTSDKSSMISSFKRTFSLTPSRRKATNPKWSASLMSLQQIDVMISYEDLSFIDYDKFNTYEENLMSKIKSSNQIDVNRTNAERFPGVKMRTRSSREDAAQRRHSTVYQQTEQTDNDTINWLNVPSKRWSNPCMHTEGASYPSYASIVKVQPSDGVDECDNIPSKKCSIELNRNSTNTAYSIDDLTQKSNSDLLPQTVSVFTCSFCSLHSV